MSITLKNFSEDTVSSVYRIPVVDLCSDDEKPVAVSHAITRNEGKKVHTIESPTSEEKGVKKLKYTLPNMLPEFDTKNVPKLTANVQSSLCWAGEEYDKFEAETCAPSVVFIDISDESSG